MLDPNEQIVLKAAVSYKKNKGTLTVTSKRVGWAAIGAKAFSISVPFANIKAQMQSLPNAAKVMLKLTTTSTDSNSPADNNYTFEFSGPKALQERDAFKDLITQNLTRIRGSSPSTPSNTASPATTPAPSPLPAPVLGGLPGGLSSEIQARLSLLSKNKELQSLHQELVMTTKTVTEAEFWESPYVKRIRQQQLKKDQAVAEGQQKGRSSQMVNLLPGTQEGADVKYTLTSQNIHDIFAQYPSVKRGYDVNVPDKLSEEQFWKRFLASQFFHRSRAGIRATTVPKDDLFDKCMAEEDEENTSVPKSLNATNIHRLIDLASTEEDHVHGGNSPDLTMVPGRTAQSLPLIRRFNRHAMQNKIENEILIEDLEAPEPPNKIVLDIQDTRRYFESQSGGAAANVLESKDSMEVLKDFAQKAMEWQPDITQRLIGKTPAERVMHELTGVIRKKLTRARAKESDAKLPVSIQHKLTAYQSATNEILRHFWASAEPNYRADKNARMVEALRKQQEKARELLALAGPEDNERMIGPVTRAVDKALAEGRKKVLQKKIAPGVAR
ncbi:hypothetical protein BC938DRAFT_471655 [Jimgerdemannia flammicorona]|nr:hypothetical protein BC938DRAFT_471655 [Jimgerdemannia flammicorona]